MTSYDLTALMVLANVASEPLVYKITSKAFLGTLTISVIVVLFGWLSLKKVFYNFDVKPDIVIMNGVVDRKALKRNRMNLPYLLSLLRLQGYANISDIEFALIEPNGNLSVIPKSQNRPVTPADLNIPTNYEGLALPLIIDGRVIYDNLKYAKLTSEWLNNEVRKVGAAKMEDVFLAEISSGGKLSVNLYNQNTSRKPEII
jgi:uncharacterized membrane protein YcaP (DUF421 family)